MIVFQNGLLYTSALILCLSVAIRLRLDYESCLTQKDNLEIYVDQYKDILNNYNKFVICFLEYSDF